MSSRADVGRLVGEYESSWLKSDACVTRLDQRVKENQAFVSGGSPAEVIGPFRVADFVRLVDAAVRALQSSANSFPVNVSIGAALVAELLSAGFGNCEVFEQPKLDDREVQRTWKALAALRNALFHPASVSFPGDRETQSRKAFTSSLAEALDRDEPVRQELEASPRALQGLAMAQWALRSVAGAGRYRLFALIIDDLERRKIAVSTGERVRLHQIRDGARLGDVVTRAPRAKSFAALIGDA